MPEANSSASESCRSNTVKSKVADFIIWTAMSTMSSGESCCTPIPPAWEPSVEKVDTIELIQSAPLSSNVQKKPMKSTRMTSSRANPSIPPSCRATMIIAKVNSIVASSQKVVVSVPPIAPCAASICTRNVSIGPRVGLSSTICAATSTP